MSRSSVRDAWRQDLRRNSGSLKGRILVSLYRFGRVLPPGLRSVYRWPYWLLTDCVMGVTLPLSLDIGAGLSIQHGQGLVLSPLVRIGDRVNLHQGVTIGERRKRAPTLESGVSVGANAVIIGGITIGHDSVIGAGAVVIHDVPPGSVVVGVAATARPRKDFVLGPE